MRVNKTHDEAGDLFLMRETLGYRLAALCGEEVETPLVNKRCYKS